MTRKNNLTCFWAISEVFWFEPILSMPSKNITPRWALDKSKSALRYNFDITELIVSLFSSHPDINSTRLPRRSCNFRGGGRTLELFLPFDDFSVRAQRSETALRNSPGDFWVSGLQEKNVKIKNNFLAGNLKKNVAPTAKHLVFCYHNCSDLLWEKNVLGIEKNFEITRTIYSNSERSEPFLVTEFFFNWFLVCQI